VHGLSWRANPVLILPGAGDGAAIGASGAPRRSERRATSAGDAAKERLGGKALRPILWPANSRRWRQPRPVQRARQRRGAKAGSIGSRAPPRDGALDCHESCHQDRWDAGPCNPRPNAHSGDATAVSSTRRSIWYQNSGPAGQDNGARTPRSWSTCSATFGLNARR
jgi:hypothetical protein